MSTTTGASSSVRPLRRLAVVASTIAVAVLLAACGTSSANGSSTTTSTSSSGSTGSGSTKATVKLGTVFGYGSVLVDGAGRTLYLFVPDHQGASTCTGACASAWPPLVASGQPTAGHGVDASLLGTVKNSDGTVQVTYNRWPLYTFSGDGAVGYAKGEGLATFGGKWWVLGANGKSIQSAVGSSSATTGSSGGSGY